jgi:hypothetical protein
VSSIHARAKSIVGSDLSVKSFLCVLESVTMVIWIRSGSDLSVKSFLCVLESVTTAIDNLQKRIEKLKERPKKDGAPL